MPFVLDDVRAYILDMLMEMAKLAQDSGDERLAADLEKMARQTTQPSSSNANNEELGLTKPN